MSANGDRLPKVPGREPRRPLSKRFYTSVTVAPCEPSAGGPTRDGTAHGSGRTSVRVLLDAKPALTPKSRELVLPALALANAVAGEWDAQRPSIDPASMPLTRLVNTVIDGVQGRESEVREDIVKFAGSDLLCYRAEGPEKLVALQAATWDPILAWANSTLRIPLAPSRGVMPAPQGRESFHQAGHAVARLDAFRLAALHVMVTLTGSAILGLAVLNAHLSAEAAWAAAHVDEDWQIAHWGEDTEAVARRLRRWADMQTAAETLRLLG